MKKLNDNVVAAWMALSLLISSLPLCLILGLDLKIFYDLSIIDLVLFVTISIFTIFGQTLRFMAISQHPLTGL